MALIDDMDWQPLSEIWDQYNESLEEAIAQGYIDDQDLAEEYVWPTDLSIGKPERKDVQKYVHERMTEIVDKIKEDHGLDSNFIAGVVFRSLICGMMWERERIGN